MSNIIREITLAVTSPLYRVVSHHYLSATSIYYNFLAHNLTLVFASFKQLGLITHYSIKILLSPLTHMPCSKSPFLKYLIIAGTPSVAREKMTLHMTIVMARWNVDRIQMKTGLAMCFLMCQIYFNSLYLYIILLIKQRIKLGEGPEILNRNERYSIIHKFGPWKFCCCPSLTWLHFSSLSLRD